VLLAVGRANSKALTPRQLGLHFKFAVGKEFWMNLALQLG